MNNLDNFLVENKIILNNYAKKYIEKLDIPVELKNSILYSLINEGKKIRPLMFLLMLKHYNIDYMKYLDIALSIELMHVYSLIHDDLPSMDNDDYRWGKLTNHNVFGEDVAILSGDAMQSLSFEIVSTNKYIDDATKIKLIELLAKYSGVAGMISGQIYDIKQKNYNIDKSYLKKMHKLKTGNLLILPLLFACYISKRASDLELLTEFGKELGIAYQIKDDILDYYGEFDMIGKLPSDEGKITYLSFYGIKECESLLEFHTENAKKISLELQCNFLYNLSDKLLIRKK